MLAGLLFLAPSASAFRETPGQLLQAALNRSIADRSTPNPYIVRSPKTSFGQTARGVVTSTNSPPQHLVGCT